MALSNDLIMQFVKATKDNDKTKKESTAYGTIVEHNGSKYVQLDGAETPTPISSTATANVGERVTVLIKDHSAIITGNLSSPSARTGDVKEVVDEITEFEIAIGNKVSTEELDAERARIDVLEADTVAIKGMLTASDADIENIIADTVTINKKLDANAADIEDLKTSKLDASVANVQYAKIVDLEAEVADIDTLIFGSATGTTIQTSFANAVIAQLGDAQIKSAMIQDISASKIKSGDIITNNVRVLSEDGKLLISDETIQISDDTRVRVQIGKDTSNDYSINIWDAEGNLMFSKGGITDSAIKEAIIRNDMVSDTANIAAHKLDIDSLFEEINGSTKTINSTRVYLDEEKQSLDLAFKSVTSDVEELQNGVTSQGTEIQVIKDQITSKVWQQDIDTATDEMSTQYTTLEQEVDGISATVANHTALISDKADSSTVTEVSDKVASLEVDVSGFKTTVSDTYATKASVSEVEQTATDLSVRFDSLEIGGRNLILNSETFIGNNIGGSVSTVSGTYANLHVKSFDNSSDTSNSKDIIVLKQIYVKNLGDQYTFSFYAKGGGTLRTYFYGATGYVTCVKTEQSNGNISTQGDGSSPWTLTDTWTRYWVTWTLSDEGDISIEKYILFRLAGGAVANVCGVKLELGNKATDWTPAPEDVQNEIDDAAKTATNYLNFSTSGLVVGDMTSGSLGKNVLIDSDSVDIRNGNTVMASFGASELILGQNAEDSVINLCDGAATISTITSGATTSYPHYDGINIASEEIELSSSQFRVDTTSGSSFVNSGTIRLANQSSAAGSTSSFKSECKITSTGSKLTTGLLASATSSASTTCTDIYATHYNASSSTTNSNYISVYPTHTQMSKPITINGVYFTGLNKVLWTGGYYMQASHSITLSESISSQVNGIVLVWSFYMSGVVEDYSFQFHYVPKWFISNFSGKGVDFALANHTGNSLGHKYLYFTDTKITGHDYNSNSKVEGTYATYTNTNYVLRAVIGV